MKKLPLKSLKKKLWKKRSELIRQRDADFQGYVSCFTCPKRMFWKEMDCGHYHSRIYDFTTELLTDNRNVQPQCKGDNGYKSGKPQEYALALLAKYGEDVLVELQAKKNTPKHWKYSEIEELIEEYTNKVKELD